MDIWCLINKIIGRVFVVYCLIRQISWDIRTKIKMEHAGSPEVDYILKGKAMTRILGSVVLSLSVFCIPTISFAAEDPPVCVFKGMGLHNTQVGSGDFFYGEVTEFSGAPGDVLGKWTHRLPTGEVMIGDPNWMFCRPNGSRLIDFSGPATFNGVPGYIFLASIQDRTDYDGALLQTVTATRTSRPTEWQDGVVAIEGEAAVKIPETLNVVAGYANHGWATLTFIRSASEDRVVCRYRANGDTFTLKKCTGEDPGTLQVEANCFVAVREMTLHVQNVQPNLLIRVEVELPVASPIVPDTYQLRLFDPSLVEVYMVDQNLISGDLKGDF